MAILELPIDSQQVAFKFKVTLDSILVELEFHFNSRYERWFMNMLDENGNMILAGRPMMTNLDLTGRFADGRIPPGFMFPFNITQAFEDAGFEDLGEDVPVFYEEVES